MTAGATAPLSYQWLRDNLAVAGANSSSYTTPATVDGDQGARFSATVSNSAGSVTSAQATLTVTPRPVAPTVDNQPASLSVNEGQTATFTVRASSNNSAPTYQWRRNGQDVADATSTSYTTAPATAADEGAQFLVAVSNTAGTTTSSLAVLSVNSAPRISVQPQAAAQFVGQTATFSVSATGTAPLSYQWRRGATASATATAIAGATASTFTTGALSLTDHASVFSVQVSNALGSVTSDAASLSVTPAPAAPTISTQPLDATVLAGRAASFSVVAAGTAPLSYQWLRNGTAISGAQAANYSTQPLLWTDTQGTYSVEVRNGVGQVTSRLAQLTVNPRVVQISTGGSVASARKEDGTVWSWGLSSLFGNGSTGSPAGTMARAQNTNGTLFNGVASVSNGVNHTLALKADGTLWAWGDNTFGAIGIGQATTTQATPVQVRDAGGNAFTGVSKVFGGWQTSFAIKADGSAWSWGYAYGGLGNGFSGTGNASPATVKKADGTALGGIVQLSGTNDHTLALASDGTVWIWGNGQSGRLGDGNFNSSAPLAQRLTDSLGAPISGVMALSAGDAHSVLVLADGTALAFGVNNYGQLADGSLNTRVWAWQVKDSAGNPFNNIRSAVAGAGTTAFLRNDGTVWMAGRNLWGALARPDTAPNALVPMQVFYASGAALTGVTQLAFFDYTVLVLLSDSTVWGWGGNQSGELGTASPSWINSPVKISVSGD